MGFNYAAEKKKFETLWARLRREYRAAGMSDAAIQKMHDFDWEVFKQERIYRLHKRSAHSCGQYSMGSRFGQKNFQQ